MGDAETETGPIHLRAETNHETVALLREFICALRSARGISDPQLCSDHHSAESEDRAPDDILRSLNEEVRAELKIFKKSGGDGIGGKDDSSDRVENVQSNLTQDGDAEQLVSLRESRKSLREESEKSNSIMASETESHEKKEKIVSIRENRKT